MTTSPQTKSISDSYDKIAHEYTAKHGYCEHLSIPSLNKFLSHLPSNSHILDIGCGGGQDSKYLYDHQCSVLGIDISSEMIKLAKQHSPQTQFLHQDIFDLDPDNQFDGIWCCRVFQHIPLAQQQLFILKVKTLLKNNGILYLTSVISDTEKDYEAYDSGNENLLKKRLTPTSFQALLKQNNFDILEINYWSDNKSMEIFARHI